jgi:alanine dehydrogenase
MTSGINIGMARMHVEAGERRDFLPEFIAHLENHGGRVVLESGYGSGMGYQEKDYRLSAPKRLRHRTALSQRR